MRHRNRLFMLYICAGILAGPCLADAPGGASKDTDEIAMFQALTTSLHDAFTTGDSAVWDRALDDKFIMTSEEGIVLDKKELLKDITPLPHGFSGTQKVRNLTVQDLGDAAVVHFWLDEWETVLGEKLFTTYIETDTYRRRGAGWSMVAAEVAVEPRDFAPLKVDNNDWPSLQGTYGMNGSSDWTLRIYTRDGKLYAAHTPATETELIPLSPLTYYEKGTIHILVFVRDDKGTVDQLLELHKYNEVFMKRLATPSS